MSEKSKILYIDDEEINVQLFVINFSEKYEVFTSLDGFNGIETLSKNQGIKVVICDMKMPKMNGIEFVKKAKEVYISVQYFILTGYDITDEIKQAIDSKLILRYFKKPFNLVELEDAINDAILKTI